MAISLKTQKILWTRAGNRCAFPNCHKELVCDATGTDDESVIGQVCHIVAKKPCGPRGDSTLSLEQLDEYDNLILLCSIHHTVVDDQTRKYTVERLRQMKHEHESWVHESLAGFDLTRQSDDEQYADIIQQFCDRVAIDDWAGWSSWVLSGGQPCIAKDIHDKLEGVGGWLLSRVWPNRYPEIENSLENFRLVLQDFLNEFAKHSEPFGDDMFTTRKFYQIPKYNPQEYERLLGLYEFHVSLVQDLMLELTRAANYVCDQVRDRFFPAFRLRDGVVLVTNGPYMDMKFRTQRCEYRGEERTEKPYPGLEIFMSMREQRDCSFGHGTQPEAPDIQAM